MTIIVNREMILNIFQFVIKDFKYDFKYCLQKPHKNCPVVLLNDGYTIDVGLEIADTIKTYTGHNPYIIINHIRRAKLDPNREITVGAQNNPQC